MISSRQTDEEIRQIYYAEPADTTTQAPTIEEQETEPETPAPDDEEKETEPETPAPVTEEQDTAPENPEITPAAEETDITVTPENMTAEAQAPEETPATRLESVVYPGNPKLQVGVRFKALRKESRQIVGWLYIDHLIDEAVVQKNNTFYLDHDVYGKENVNGALFLDAVINLKKQPFSYLVYGHNMKTGEKFGCLRNYENINYYHSNPYISFETMYEGGQYVIFSVGNVSTLETDSNYVDLYALVFPEIEERQQAIDALKKLSIYTSTVDVQVDDQLLLLITCVGRDEERRVVAARRIRNEESKTELSRLVLLSGKK